MAVARLCAVTILSLLMPLLRSVVNFFNALPERDSTVNIEGHDADVAPSIFVL